MAIVVPKTTTTTTTTTVESLGVLRYSTGGDTNGKTYFDQGIKNTCTMIVLVLVVVMYNGLMMKGTKNDAKQLRAKKRMAVVPTTAK
jgi:hypothetical protein